MNEPPSGKIFANGLFLGDLIGFQIEYKGILSHGKLPPPKMYNCKCTLLRIEDDPLALRIQIGDHKIATPYRISPQPFHGVTTRRCAR